MKSASCTKEQVDEKGSTIGTYWETRPPIVINILSIKIKHVQYKLFIIF